MKNKKSFINRIYREKDIKKNRCKNKSVWGI